jgi:hypothetical protein
MFIFTTKNRKQILQILYEMNFKKVENRLSSKKSV